jgi:hypothetical protein
MLQDALKRSSTEKHAPSYTKQISANSQKFKTYMLSKIGK